MTKKNEFVKMVWHFMKDMQLKEQDVYDFEEAWSYFTDIQSGDAAVAVKITEKGRQILVYMNTHFNTDNKFLAKDIAEGMGINSRSVSGSMRKLVSDGLVGKEPFGNSNVYYITIEGIAALA
jgi:predicted transcriptional regulator